MLCLSAKKVMCAREIQCLECRFMRNMAFYSCPTVRLEQVQAPCRGNSGGDGGGGGGGDGGGDEVEGVALLVLDERGIASTADERRREETRGSIRSRNEYHGNAHCSEELQR